MATAQGLNLLAQPLPAEHAHAMRLSPASRIDCPTVPAEGYRPQAPHAHVPTHARSIKSILLTSRSAVPGVPRGDRSPTVYIEQPQAAPTKKRAGLLAALSTALKSAWNRVVSYHREVSQEADAAQQQRFAILEKRASMHRTSFARSDREPRRSGR